MNFKIEKKINNCLGRAGMLETPHGVIETPAFVAVGTKGTVKALSPEQVNDLGAQAVLANTYHLYLEPGDINVKKAGGLHKFMNWNGPILTDSGGFQVFSLGEAFGKKVGKIKKNDDDQKDESVKHGENEIDGVVKLAKIDEDGVDFKSVIDGSTHRFTPERSMEIQYNLGADIIFAFDECTSPEASYEYQKEAMDRTHRWAKRSLIAHNDLDKEENQALFGIVQGGRHKDLREASARIISSIGSEQIRDFDGFGIGGSFDKEDMYTVVGWVNKILPENKPRHLLGIGEPEDFFGGIENGADLFDCVAPTRMARNGTLHTKNGKINILNSKFREDLSPIEEGCGCYACSSGYSKAYLAHLFRSKEIFASTLASIHNLYFIVNLVKKIRQSILDDNFFQFKEEFLKNYTKTK